jgi:signal transduction histidine kinase
LAERTKATVLKTVGRLARPVGSNPTPSAPGRGPETPAEPRSSSARIQPALVGGATVVALPAVMSGPAPTWVVTVLCALLATSIVLGVVHHRVGFAPATRRRLPLLLTLTALAILLLVLWADGGSQPEAYVLLMASFITAVAATPSAPWRWTFQGTAIAGIVLAVHAAGEQVGGTMLLAALLLAVAAVAEVFFRELSRARLAAAEQRRAAERRAELLQTVRELPGSSVADASRAVTRTLRALAFDAAGVAEINRQVLVAVHLDNLTATGAPVARGSGVSWQAIEQDRTIVLSDYRTAEHRLPERDQLGAVVVTPIRLDGEPRGTLMCARFEPGEPSPAEIEIAEVLAAHLGGVVAAERRLDRQRELLDRAAELDRMRAGLVSAVTSEIRDPLAIVRGIAAILGNHGDDVGADQRRVFLERLQSQSQDLRRVVDAILAFSHLQARRREPQVRVVPFSQVVGALPLGRGVELETSTADGRAHVCVDLELLRLGFELLLEPREDADGRVRPVHLCLTSDVDGDVVELIRRPGGNPEVSALTISLASQLLMSAGATVVIDDGLSIRLPLVQPAGVM